MQKSHIIPEFLYQTLYDEKHRLQMLSTITDQPNWQEQKGLREKLLCKSCEQKFSAWERYASLVLKGGVPLTHRQEGSIVHISGIDYQKFKLFQLSILWRAGISNLEFFKKVQLGNHAEKLRCLLAADDPGPPERYGCLMFGLKHGQQTFTQIIMQPSKTPTSGHTVYCFVFGGFMWVMLASSHNASSLINQCTLSRDGKTVLQIRNATEMQNLAEFSRELIRMGRSP